MVRRSNEAKRVTFATIRRTTMGRCTFMRLPVADPFWTKSLGTATACRRRKPAGCLGQFFVFASILAPRLPDCCTRDGVSPAYVFYGRYSIHESWLVSFQRFFLGCAGPLGKGRASVPVHAARRSDRNDSDQGDLCRSHRQLLACRHRPRRRGKARRLRTRRCRCAPALVLAGSSARRRHSPALTIVFFYSGTFLDFSGLERPLRTFAAWFHTGVEAAGHEKIDLSDRAFQLLLDGAHGALRMARLAWTSSFAFLHSRPRKRVLDIIAIYGCGVVAGLLSHSIQDPVVRHFYSLAVLFPAGEPSRHRRPSPSGTTCSLPLAFRAGGEPCGQRLPSVRLNFLSVYQREANPMSTCRHFPDIETLTKPLLEMARKDPRYYHVQGQILLDSYYPLPWMLGDFTQIGYYKEGGASRASRRGFCRCAEESNGADRIRACRRVL